MMYYDIVNAFDNNNIVRAVFMDINVAYSNVLINFLI
jgi:hypothetical protein